MGGPEAEGGGFGANFVVNPLAEDVGLTGAEWAEPAIVIEKINYRADGEGYLESGFNHLFVVPADGGTPRQVTRGDYNHNGAPAWSSDGRSLVFSANRHDDWETSPVNSEVYSVSLDDGAITSLTERNGPDMAPVVSPDGSRIAYLGNDDHRWGYHVTNLYVMNADGSAGKQLIADLDRDVAGLRWSADGRGLFFQYDDEGNTKVAFAPLDGEFRMLAESLGGNSIGRPYGGGSFSTSTAGSVAYTYGIPSAPADVAVVGAGGENHRVVTALNDDVLEHKELGQVEEIWFESSHDGRRVQGWIVKPPGFDPARTYPLVLEIHGGPFANYGDRFAAELQLYAAAGNVVLYTNPRGSTSYGQEFGNLIHHSYPGNDYHDLMSGVDAVIERGYVDADNLFVTGGSGGGVLTAWIVGNTDRFRAAVSQKPVINWYSWALTADIGWISNYWFPGPPWEHQDQYMARSPISLVGNVTTPTMLLTGEEDHRTPIPESEQFYQALKMQGVDAALVRIPGSSHGIASRPSNLIAKVQHVLAWFDRYKVERTPATDSDR